MRRYTDEAGAEAEDVLVMPKRATSSEESKWRWLLDALMALIAFGGALALLAVAAHHGVFKLGLVSMAAIGVVGFMTVGHFEWPTREAKRVIAARHASDDDLPETSIRELPTEADERVRIRGKLRVVLDDGRPRVWIESGGDIAVLADGTPLRVASEESFAELDGVDSGTTVVVVGRGHREVITNHPAVRGTYRAPEPTFVFDAADGVDIWV